jgi:hypothetical protein
MPDCSTSTESGTRLPRAPERDCQALTGGFRGGHTVALVRRCSARMIRWRLAVPAVLSLAALAGCLTYFRLPSAPVQPSTLLAPTEAEAPSIVGQAWATDTPTVVDRLRPSDEDIAKAFRQATENQQPVGAQEAALDTDEPAIAGPIPLPKKRPPPHP